MTTIEDLTTLYYIKDCFGNFYRLNGDRELVTAKEQVEAGIFTYLEVAERLGGGKKSQFYQAVPVEGPDKKADPGKSPAPAVSSNAIAVKTRDAIERIKKKEAGTYRPRVSPDLFTDLHLRPRKLHRCFAEGCQDKEEDSGINSCDNVDEPEREEYEMAEVSYERIGTIYDECRPDWLELFFASRQNSSGMQKIISLISDTTLTRLTGRSSRL